MTKEMLDSLIKDYVAPAVRNQAGLLEENLFDRLVSAPEVNEADPEVQRKLIDFLSYSIEDRIIDYLTGVRRGGEILGPFDVRYAGGSKIFCEAFFSLYEQARTSEFEKKNKTFTQEKYREAVSVGSNTFLDLRNGLKGNRPEHIHDSSFLRRKLLRPFKISPKSGLRKILSLPFYEEGYVSPVLDQYACFQRGKVGGLKISKRIRSQ